MNPDIDLRLRAIDKALDDVIARVIPAGEAMARDQLALVRAHLRVIGTHWKYALRYELGTLDALFALARRLETWASSAAGQVLAAAQAAAVAVDRADYDQVSAAQRALAAAIDAVIAAEDASAPMPSELREAVLAHYAWAAPRERVWHQGSGLDPDAPSLPAIAGLFAADGGTG